VNPATPCTAPDRFQRPALFCVLAALLFRLVCLGMFSGSPLFGEPFLDQKIYTETAELIAEGNRLDAEQAFRNPAYALFLASIIRVGGSEGAYFWVLLLQTAMGAAAAGFIAHAATLLFDSSRAGWLAGMLMALSGPVVVFDSLRLATTPSMFFCSLAIWLFAHMHQSRDALGLWATVAFSTLCWWTAAQLRPHVLLIAIAWPVLLLWKVPRPRLRAMIILPIALGTLGIAHGLYSTTIARVIVPGIPAGASSGINFYLGNAPPANGMMPVQTAGISATRKGVDPIFIYSREEFQRRNPDRPVPPGPELSSYWLNTGLREAAAEPGRWLKLVLQKVFFVVWNRELPNNENYRLWAQHEIPLLQFWPIRWALLLCLLVPGALAAWRRNPRAAGILLGCALLYAAGLCLFFVAARFRIPLWPLLSCLAGAAALAPWAVQRRSWIAGAILALVSLSNPFSIPLVGDAPYHFFRSVGALSKGNLEQALIDGLEAARIAPAAPEYHAQLGIIFFASERFSEARVAFQRSLAIQPNQPGVWSNLGYALLRSGDPSNATNAFQKALQIAPELHTALEGLRLLQQP